MEKLEDVFEYVKCVKFLEGFTDINPNGGIRHRLIGIKTNTIDKKSGLTDKDKGGLVDGLQKFVNDVQNLIDKNK